MTRLGLRTQILLPILFGFIFLSMTFIFSWVAWLQPELFNAKHNSDGWKIRTPGEILQDAWIARVGLLVVLGAGLYIIVSTLKDYIFYIRGERLHRKFDQIDPTKIVSIGPITGLKDKGLTISLYYEPPWQTALGSFRLWPSTPIMTYHARLLGRLGNDTVLIEERTFLHEEEGDEGEKYRPNWKEETFTIVDQYQQYFIELTMETNTERLIWPKRKSRGVIEDKPGTPWILLRLQVDATLRLKDLANFRANPDCSLRSAKVEIVC